MQNKITTHFIDLKVATTNILAVFTIFCFGSCCFIPVDQTAKKSCNCSTEKDMAHSSRQKRDAPSGTHTDIPLNAGTGTKHAVAEEKQSTSLITGMPEDYPPQNEFGGYTGIEEAVYVISPALPMPNAEPANGYSDFLQQNTEKKLPLGIKKITSHLVAGPNISFKSSKEDYGSTQHKHKPGAGFQAGIRSDYFFSDKFAVSAGLLFKQQNASEELNYSSPGEPGGGNYNEKSTTKYQYNYLSVPLMALFNVSENLSVTAGPEMNYLVGSSYKTNDGDKASLTKNSTRFGVGVQAAVKYKFAGAPIAIEMLYDHRISRLNKKTTEYSPGSSYESPAWNMKGIQLSIVCALCELMKKR